MNTEVLLEGSHKNSTVLSCVGFALGSMMPTDMGISAGAHAESQVLLGGEAEGSRGIRDRLHISTCRRRQSSGGSEADPEALPRALTDVQDPVPGPVPPPALQLLVLRVLQAPVVKHHPENALEGTNCQRLRLSQQTPVLKAFPSTRKGAEREAKGPEASGRSQGNKTDPSRTPARTRPRVLLPTAPAGPEHRGSPLTFTSFPLISGSSPIFLLSSIRISYDCPEGRKTKAPCCSPRYEPLLPPSLTF